MKNQSETELEEKSILHYLKLNSRGKLIRHNLKLNSRERSGRVCGGLDWLTKSETDISLFLHNRCSHTPEFGQHDDKEENEEEAATMEWRSHYQVIYF